MPTKTFFEMRVVEVFRFADGRTVFVGTVDPDVPIIAASECDLFVDGTQKATCVIEGEMIPDRRQETGFRSVSTKSNVELDRDLLKHSDCRLRTSDA
jgi:hypothetical protein